MLNPGEVSVNVLMIASSSRDKPCNVTVMKQELGILALRLLIAWVEAACCLQRQGE